jgi:NAD(P)-dependent dehydrogenase (short-subunit alcohol dehydrogenase family)
VSTLTGSTAIVTGAGGGVGRGIAIALARRGARVGLLVRRPETGDAVAAEIATGGGTALSVPCDVSSDAELERAVAAVEAAFGAISVVVHNATAGRTSSAEHLGSLDATSWAEHVGVGLRPCHRLARLCARSLIERQGAFIVLTSVDGLEGDEDLPLYSTVKGAQRGFVKALAREWGPSGVRVNCLAPLAMTPALERAMQKDPTLHDRIAPLVPLGHFGDPADDIGPAAAFLAGEDARYVTGQTLLVNGGRYTAL